VPPKKTLSRKTQPAALSGRGINVAKSPVRLSSAPLPDFIEPMKATLVDSIRSGDWLYEIKFDDYRALALRGGSEIRILGWSLTIRDSIAALDVQDVIVDDEIVALDDKGRSSFQLLQGFDMGMVRPPLVFYTFDLLRLNGKDLRGLPVEERKAKLAALLKEPAARPSKHWRASGQGPQFRIGRLSPQTCRLQVLMPNGRARGSRLSSISKAHLSLAATPNPPEKGSIWRALLVGFYENKKLKFAGRVGTGFTEKLLKALSVELNKIAVNDCPFDNLPATRRGLDPGLTAAEMKRCVWAKPIDVCEVKFTEWTRDDRLRQAVFLGLRKDKCGWDPSGVRSQKALKNRAFCNKTS
jgi:bifunctional non-homologous end joining protein LigD